MPRVHVIQSSRKYFHALVAPTVNVIVGVNTSFSSNPNVFKDASSRIHYYGLSPLQTLSHSPETLELTALC